MNRDLYGSRMSSDKSPKTKKKSNQVLDQIGRAHV